MALGPFHGPKIGLPSLLRYSQMRCKSSLVPFEDLILGWITPMSNVQGLLPRKGLPKRTKACQWQLPSAWVSSAPAQSGRECVSAQLNQKKISITHIPNMPQILS